MRAYYRKTFKKMRRSFSHPAQPIELGNGMIEVKVECGADAVDQRERCRRELLLVAYSFAVRVSFPKALALV